MALFVGGICMSLVELIVPLALGSFLLYTAKAKRP